MIEDTIKKIERRIAGTETLPEKTRDDLSALLVELKDEIEKLPATHGEHAESITQFMDASTHEATRQSTDQSLLDLSIQGLEQSVKDFEVTYPKLAETVNSFCSMLSGIGI
jgi:archaellum component FlaC